MTPSIPSTDNSANTEDCQGCTVIDCLRQATIELHALHSRRLPDSADAATPKDSSDALTICRLEAEVLLAFVLGKSHSWLYAWPEKNINNSEQDRYRLLIAERCTGKPVAYLTGSQEFWSMNYKVSPEVLIPRADTELLVEIALDFFATNQQVPLNTGQTKSPACILELGTGSGAIAIALASELDHVEITATDISAAALDVARYNAQHLLAQKASQITFVQSDWFENLVPARASRDEKTNGCNDSYQLIVSNPPYIRADDSHLSTTVTGISFEPRAALVAQDNGLEALRQIIEGAKPLLADGAMLALEHGHDQAAAVRQLLQHAGYLSIESRKDLAGVERVTLGHHNSVKF